MSAKKDPAKNVLPEKAVSKKYATKTTRSKAPTSGTQKMQNEAGDESSQKDAKPNKDLSGDTLSLSPRRLKIVELATQLVTAQIAASASYQVALGQAREQCDMIKDLSKLLISGEVTEREDIFQRIAGYSMISIRKPRELKPLSFGEFDELFESAMCRAQWMLRTPEQDRRVVYAEQLFGQDELLTENQIRDRFIAYKWPGMASGDPVIKLMTNVDSLFSSHFEFLNTSFSTEVFTRKIQQCDKQYKEEIDILSPALVLCREKSGDGFDYHSKYFSVAADSIENVITLRKHEGYENVAPPIRSEHLRKLIVHMFNGSAPKPRKQNDVGESPSGKKKSSPRKYRAWGIFRYLRIYGNIYPSLDGTSLNAKLRAERRELNPDMVPNIVRVESEEYNFGPLGDFVDDFDPLLEEGGVEEEMYYEVYGRPREVVRREVE